MANDANTPQLEPDVREVILKPDERTACETYIFEPAPEERQLGRMYVVAETDNRGGVGAELLEITAQALQREYYRDASRGVLASFESALHQANLILHDTADQGVRDWMGNFHVVAVVLQQNTIHLSCAGNAAVMLIRQSRAALVSKDLSYSPITDPLRTFSQVASGTVQNRDALYLGTSHLVEIFRREDLIRFALDRSASTIATRLQQLYADQGCREPLAALVVTLLPPHIVAMPANAAAAPNLNRPRTTPAGQLAPRRPITIHRTIWHALAALIIRAIITGGRWIMQSAWPAMIKSSKKSGHLIATASRSTGRTVTALMHKNPAPEAAEARENLEDTRQRSNWKGMFMAAPAATRAAGRALSPRRWLVLLLETGRRLPAVLWRLPRSSKIFALLTLLLAVALTVSVALLKEKRASDAEIQRAGEVLQEARAKVSAAETALIINKRDQARSLLNEARTSVSDLQQRRLYDAEAAQLSKKVQSLTDQTQKIVRASSADVHVIGDFAAALNGTVPKHLALINDNLYAFNPKTNAVAAMGMDGKPKQVLATTQGVGFFTATVPMDADKTIMLATDTPGIALFDTKTNTVTGQDIALPGTAPAINSLGVYGNRLYTYDRAAANIFAFSKTLRGYTGGAAWITDQGFPKDNIKNIAIDGSIYTLHADGVIRNLYKGQAQDFAVDAVEPDLKGATKIITWDNAANLYVFDPVNKRVLVFSKEGKLQRQVLLDVAQDLSDVAITPDESAILALDGTRVLSVSAAAKK